MNAPPEAERPLLILGTRTFALEVADVAREAGFDVAGFVENEHPQRARQELDGLPIHWVEDLRDLVSTHTAVCGLGTTFRSRFTDQIDAIGLPFARVVHPSARVSATSEVGEGCVLSAGVIIGARTRLGRHVLLNRGALVGHHVEIGDFVSLGPGANVAGSSSIGEAAYLGMGTIVVNGVRVGAHSVLGAGAVAIDEVPDHVLSVGVPARIVRRDVPGK